LKSGLNPDFSESELPKDEKKAWNPNFQLFKKLTKMEINYYLKYTSLLLKIHFV
jgi:hypothetical protein